jgi:hypothetical protein
MKLYFAAPLLLMLLLLTGCIGDDLVFDEVDPELRITTSVDTLGINTDYQFKASYFNSVGIEEAVQVDWTSADDSIISISAEGRAQGLKLGTTMLHASYNNGKSQLMDSALVTVGMSTVNAPVQKLGKVNTTSSYALTGDFTLTENGDDLVLELAENYNASTALPGLYVYLSNNANSSAGAFEIGAVEVFAGTHTYFIGSTGINDYTYVLYYCKPFNVKVGHGEIN